MTTFHSLTRSIVRHRGFSASIVAVTALGVGVNAAVFTMVHSILLRDLPFRSPDELVMLTEAARTFDTGLVSPTAYLEWRDRKPPLSDMAAFMWWEGSGEDATLTVSVTPNYFAVLGVKPLIGRTFTEEENRAGFSSAMILSYETWQRKFGGDPSIVGRPFRDGNWSPVIAGVMPPAPVNLNIGWGDVWRPIRLRQQYNRSEISSARYLRVVGRLKPGMNRDRALAALSAVQHQLQGERPAIFSGYEVRMTPLREMLAGEFKPALLILLGTAACLLLLACASLANMLVARSAAHEREMAVRIALGASRGSLAMRLLGGNLMLAGAGAAIGLVLSRATILAIAHFEPGFSRLETNFASVWPVVAVCAGLALITATLVTAPVALSLRHVQVYESLKEGRGGSAGVRRQRIRGLLVSSEVALALTLLVVSGLLARSFVKLMGSDLGFRPENVLMLESTLGDSTYNTGAKRLAYYRPLMQTLAGLPGVAAVGGLRYFPMHARLWTQAIQVQETPFPPSQLPVVYTNRVASDYFDAMGIPLIAGRLPSPREMWEDASSHLALINSVAARTLFPDGRAVGKHIATDGAPLEVIGVVGSVRQAGLGKPAGPEVYSFMGSGESTGILTIAIRFRQRPDTREIQAIVEAVKHHDPSLNRPAVVPIMSFVGNTVAARRAAARLGAAFAILSLLLAALGIYGLVSYWVTQRTGEFGIRMALGASQGNVMRLVIGHCLKLASIGIALGLAASLMLARVISSFLFGIPAFDPLTFTVAPTVLLTVALLAAFRPAYAATRINAVDALRSE